MIGLINRILQLIITFPVSLIGFIRKDFLLLFKKKKYLYLSILLPIILGAIYVSMLGSNTTSISVIVCDFDNTELTKNAFSYIEGFDVYYSNDNACVDELKQGVRERDYLFGTIIQKGFSNRLENLQQSEIIIHFDDSDPAITALASWKFDIAMGPFKKQLVENFANELSNKAGDAREKITLGLQIAESIGLKKYDALFKNLQGAESDLRSLEEIDSRFMSEPIIVTKKGVYDSSHNLIDLGLAPLFCILNLFLLLMLCSTGVIYDRRNKILSRIRTSNSTILSYVLGKMVVFLAITVIQFIILYGLFAAFGASFTINIGLLLKALLFTSFVNTIIGVLIGFISDSEGIAVLISLIITLPLLFLSGMFYPLELMPNLIQFFAKIMPLNAEILMIKKAILFGGEILSKQFLAPLIIFIVTIFISKRIK